MKVASKNKIHTVYKTSSGLIVPGGSTIANMGEDKSALIGWAVKLTKEGLDYTKVRDEAAEVGTLTHAMIVSDLKNESCSIVDEYSKITIDKANWCMQSYFNWKKTHKVETIDCEFGLVSDNDKFGGTIDWYGKIDDVLTLGDWKTGSGIYPSAYTQLCGYGRLMVEFKKDFTNMLIVNIPKKETDKFVEGSINERERAIYEKIFMNNLANWWLKKELKNG